MEIQIKKAVKAGNSSAVILPRSWLNKEVRIELAKKGPEKILKEVIEIIGKYLDTGNIMGIYLAGSYSRGEEDHDSDIDVLIITKNIDLKMIEEGIYNIFVVSLGLLKQKLENDLLPVGQMLKEAKPLLNSSLLDSINVRVTKKNVAWYIKTTREKLNIINKVLKWHKSKDKTRISDTIAYTLVLRIRTLCIIEKLLKNEDYSKKNFMDLIKRVSKGSSAYERYVAVKKNLEEKSKLTIEEAESLYDYLKSQLEGLKRSL